MMVSKFTRRYHWRNDCAAQRPPYHATAIWGHDEATRLKYLKSRQIILTRREAEARGAIPCLYCSELGAPNLRLAVRVHSHRVHAHCTPQVTHTAGNASRSLGYGRLFNEVMR